MSPLPATLPATLRGALRQARTELRIQLFSPVVLSWVAFPLIGLLVLFFLRGQLVRDSGISLAQLGVPGLLTMSLVSSGVGDTKSVEYGQARFLIDPKAAS